MTEAELTAAITVPTQVHAPAGQARTASEAYYDRRFAYYRTMGEDYTDAADWAAEDTRSALRRGLFAAPSPELAALRRKCYG